MGLQKGDHRLAGDYRLIALQSATGNSQFLRVVLTGREDGGRKLANFFSRLARSETLQVWAVRTLVASIKNTDKLMIEVEREDSLGVCLQGGPSVLCLISGVEAAE